ncbi:MAG: hypothetical protein M3Z95_00770 [Actinomycetota bacterium]|nr:hypothetical protein [Actinomycetota bacterium]
MVNAETPLARIALPAMLLGALAPALIPATVPAASGARPRAGSTVSARALSASRELWATINVCNAPDQPDTVGIRGSMPGDGQAHDTLYMRFRLQYLNTSSQHWVDLADAATGFVAVGSAKAARQGGGSFQLVPVAGRPAFTLRGVVNFQWRRGASVLTAVSRATSAGRQSLAGADPAGFSAATCQIG